VVTAVGCNVLCNSSETKEVSRNPEMSQTSRENTRKQRFQPDKLALVFSILNKFTRNCYLCYVPGPHTTAD
jgi:hypothetical protein